MGQTKRPAVHLKPRLRILRGESIVLGPGKADLLGALARTGELRAAAAALGMSYMRAWKLVQIMNTAFPDPLVRTERGGRRHGTARLTAAGKRVLALYREMERASARASRPAFVLLRQLLSRDT
jgi:molybdate transport system regulatory protein